MTFDRLQRSIHLRLTILKELLDVMWSKDDVVVINDKYCRLISGKRTNTIPRQRSKAALSDVAERCGSVELKSANLEARPRKRQRDASPVKSAKPTSASPWRTTTAKCGETSVDVGCSETTYDSLNAANFTSRSSAVSTDLVRRWAVVVAAAGCTRTTSSTSTAQSISKIHSSWPKTDAFSLTLRHHNQAELIESIQSSYIVHCGRQ